MRWLFLIVVLGCGSVAGTGGGDGGGGSGKANGEACGGGGECQSGSCADGVCCDGACDGQCEACNTSGAPGQCLPVTGAPVGSRTACGGDGVCAATCDGVTRDACTFPTVACGEGTCSGTIANLPPMCSGGVCGASQRLDCTTTADTKMCGATGCAGVVDLALGLFHSCALLSDGTLRCWGQNYRGVLGLGEALVSDKLQPTPVPGLTNVTKISSTATGSDVCALLSDGTVKCWGSNDKGQLGINAADSANHNSPTSVLASPDGAMLRDVKDIAAGQNHTCALKTDSSAVCWGWGLYGRLADYNATDHNGLLPQAIQPVAALGDTIVAGSGHTVMSVGANTSAQELCWGVDGNGQCAISPLSWVTSASAPSAVFDTIDGRVARPLAAGAATTCAVVNDGTLQCWGYNANGELGRAGAGGSYTENRGYVCRNSSCTSLSDRLQRVTQATIGDGHVCAIADGAVLCWGSNTYGQLGNGTTSPQNYAANGPALSPPPALVVAGGYHTCAILADRTVACWGDDEYGQLGNGTMTAAFTGIPNPVTPVW